MSGSPPGSSRGTSRVSTPKWGLFQSDVAPWPELRQVFTPSKDRRELTPATRARRRDARTAEWVDALRNAIEKALIREAAESDQVCLAERAVIGRRMPTQFLGLLRGDEKAILVWYQSTINLFLATQAALRIQAIYRDARGTLTPLVKMAHHRALIRARVFLRRQLRTIEELRTDVKAQAATFFTQVAPPLLRRVLNLRQRLAQSTRNEGDAQGGLSRTAQARQLGEQMRQTTQELVASPASKLAALTQTPASNPNPNPNPPHPYPPHPQPTQVASESKLVALELAMLEFTERKPETSKQAARLMTIAKDNPGGYTTKLLHDKTLKRAMLLAASQACSQAPKS